jgi:hypothetical protein
VAEQKLERYFVASVGVALAAVWSLAGFTSALTCLAAGAACYGAAIVSQRGMLRRLVETAHEKQARPRTRSPHARPAKRPTAGPGSVRATRPPAARTAIGPVDADPERGEALTAQYGW